VVGAAGGGGGTVAVPLVQPPVGRWLVGTATMGQPAPTQPLSEGTGTPLGASPLGTAPLGTTPLGTMDLVMVWIEVELPTCLMPATDWLAPPWGPSTGTSPVGLGLVSVSVTGQTVV
jgi:hypothetical protein